MKLTRMSLLALSLAVLIWIVPVAAQDATAEATSESSLQTYTSPDGKASIQFPADWVSEKGGDQDSILTAKLASDESALNKELFNQDDKFEAGEVHIEVSVILLTDLATILPTSKITTESTPLDIIKAISKQGMPDEFTFGDPGETKIDGNPAVRMNLTAPKRGEGQLLLTIIDKTWVAALILYTAPGEGDKWDIIARDILTSVEINADAESTAEPTIELTNEPTIESTVEPITLTQTAKTSNGLASLSYPEGWFSRQSGDITLYISNLESGLDKSFGSKMESGEVNIFISVSTASDFIKQAELPLKDDASPLEILQGTMKAVGDTLKFGKPEQTTVGDKPAARVDFSSVEFEGTAWLIEYRKGALIAVQMLAAPGEAAQWQSTTLAIAQSVRSTD